MVGHGPFAQHRLDEPFGFAVRPGRIGPGADVARAEQAAGLANSRET
jgi:hypothetical protein